MLFKGGAALESVGIAVDAVLARERLDERHPPAQLSQRRQAAVQFARVEVMQHVAAYQQVYGGAGAQVLEVTEARQVQVAPRAKPPNRILAAVEAQVLHARTQLEQRCAPGAFAAADVEHAADRAFQVVLGAGHGQGHLARQARGATGLVGLVPALEAASGLSSGGD